MPEVTMPEEFAEAFYSCNGSRPSRSPLHTGSWCHGDGVIDNATQEIITLTKPDEKSNGHNGARR